MLLETISGIKAREKIPDKMTYFRNVFVEFGIGIEYNTIYPISTRSNLLVLIGVLH